MGYFRLYVARPVLESDVVINLPKLKTHTLTLLTGAVKNMFGAVPGFRKAEMHKLFPRPGEFASMLVDLFGQVRPALNIMDAILSMEGNGPSSGSPKETGLIAVSDDAVALDAVISGVIGFPPDRIDTTRLAGQRGLGVSDREKIEVTGDAASVIVGDFDLPSNLGMRLIPGPVARLVAPLVWLKLVIDKDKCTGCEMCFKSCPVKTIEPDGDKFRVVHEGCVQCMCCHELCPENAVEIKLSWLARKWA
jgi:Pyruvate/2-oxoacid:ferredoxin oxidoreductase delta subunit